MTVGLEVRAPLAWITLDRPDQFNALNRETLAALEQALRAAHADDSVRVVVLTGAGKAFCAGADLKSATEPAAEAEIDFLDLVSRVFGYLRELPKPVIAAVNGLAMAGGLELVLCCDLVVAAESARLGDAHANFGVLPGGGGAAVLPRRIPVAIAKQLLFTGDSMPASVFAAHGLVNEVVPDEALVETVRRLGEQVASKSPLVLAAMKCVANEAADLALADALRHEQLALRSHMHTQDFAEGIAAFAEKRMPVFTGR